MFLIIFFVPIFFAKSLDYITRCLYLNEFYFKINEILIKNRINQVVLGKGHIR